MHVFMYLCCGAAGAVTIVESCRQGQRWRGSEVTPLPPWTEVGMDGGGQDWRGEDETGRDEEAR